MVKKRGSLLPLLTLFLVTLHTDRSCSVSTAEEAAFRSRIISATIRTKSPLSPLV